MNKKDFLKIYRRPKITVWFDDARFLSDNSVLLKEEEIALGEVGDYYCPWYYDANNKQEINTGIEETLNNSCARSVTIKEVETKIKFPSKCEVIKKYIEDLKMSDNKELFLFPIATDVTASKSLVLDGNKTLIALYRSCDKNRKIRIVEIYGECLSGILVDFCIVYRS
jgi:hypothetical protein